MAPTKKNKVYYSLKYSFREKKKKNNARIVFLLFSFFLSCLVN